MENVSEHSLLIFQAFTAILMLGGLFSALLCFRHHRKKPPNSEELTTIIINRSWDTPQVGMLLSAFFLLYFLASLIGLLLSKEQIPLGRLLSTLFINASLVFMISIINRKRGGNWADSLGMGFRNLRKLPLAPVFYLAIIPFLMLTSLIYHQLLEVVFNLEVELQDITRFLSGEGTWLKACFILTAILVGPVVEELIFRGIVFSYLVKRAGLKAGILLVSLLFAAIHFHLPSFLPLALLSAALCVAYWRTGSLWVSIGIHMIFNSVSIIALQALK